MEGECIENSTEVDPTGSSELNCFGSSTLGLSGGVVAVSPDCGAGICPDHARVSPRLLTYTAVINRTVVVEPPARAIRCPACQAACDAACDAAANRYAVPG